MAGRVAQGPHRLAELPPPPDQVVDAELRDRPGDVVDRADAERPCRAQKSASGRSSPATKRLGVAYSGCVCSGGAAAPPPAARSSSLRASARARLASGCSGEREVLVEGAGQLDGVEVADGRLHGQHGGDAGAQQRLGQAGGLPVRTPPWQAFSSTSGSGRSFADGIHELVGGRPDGAAVLVLQLERPGSRGRRGGARGTRPPRWLCRSPRVAHLQDAHLDVLVPLGNLNGVQDVLQLVLMVQDRRAGVPLVWRPDGDEHLDRPGQRLAARRRAPPGGAP